MASWIVLDWDQDQLHVLCAQSSRRGVQVTRALTWAHPEPFTASTADRVGKALHDFLTAEKIAAAPVIVGVGRDRVFLKELHFPPVAAHEEASLVRFQTGKEMAEAVDNYVIDYAYLNNGDSGDRHVMTVAGRRDVVGMIQTLCQSAGLKLHAITPKLFGVTHALERAIQPDPTPLTPKHLNVVLTVGQRWAELCFFRGERLVQSQALANGPLLVNEVKRNLAVFQAQHAVSLDVEGPECLYVFGDDPAVLQNLQTGQPLKLHMLDPLRQEAEVAAEVKNPAYFAGAVGLAALWTQSVQRPVNLATPKRQAAPSSVSRQHKVFYGAGALAAVFLLVLMIFSHVQKRWEITRLTADKVRMAEELNKNAQERAEVDAYRDWEQNTVPWLDEFYDLSARNPYKEGFRINQLQATPVTQASTKKVKGAPIGKITLTGVYPSKDKQSLEALMASMNADRDPHLAPKLILDKGDPRGGPGEFKLEYTILKQDAKKYTTNLVVPPRPALIDPPAVEAKEDPELIPNPDDADKKKDAVEPEPDGGNNE